MTDRFTQNPDKPYTAAQAKVLVDHIREAIALLEAMPALTEPEAYLLTNLRQTLAEWERSDG
jgi:hypothetical protein